MTIRAGTCRCVASLLVALLWWVMGCEGDPSESDEVKLARARWEKNAPACYEIVVRVCDTRSIGEVRVSVANGRVLAAERRAVPAYPRGLDVTKEPFEPIMPGDEMRQAKPERHIVPGLFDRVAWAMGPRRGKHQRYSFAFHPKWGYPTKIISKTVRPAIDGKFTVEVVSFRPLKAKGVTEIHALAGSRVSLLRVIREEFAFVAVCEALEEAEVGESVAKDKRQVTQTFKVLDVLAGQPRRAEPVEIRYEIIQTAAYDERPARKGEKVIWFAQLRDNGTYLGRKALYNTPTKRHPRTFVERGPTAHTDRYMDFYPWVRSMPGVRCRLGRPYRLLAKDPAILALQIQNVSDRELAIWSSIDIQSIAIAPVDPAVRQPRLPQTQPRLRDEPMVLRPGEIHRATIDAFDLQWPPAPPKGRPTYLLTWQSRLRIGARDAEPIKLVSNPILITP